jgi:hypothetical protein
MVRVVERACQPSLWRERMELWLGYLQMSGEASPITISLAQNANTCVTSPAVTPSRVSTSLLKYHKIV